MYHCCLRHAPLVGVMKQDGKLNNKCHHSFHLEKKNSLKSLGNIVQFPLSPAQLPLRTLPPERFNYRAAPEILEQEEILGVG